ncbi:MAG: dipeptide epimerase [Planctomycetota bacterium]|nr:dipeptide epimerase [Planctomycetota bacterium]
MDLSWSRIPLKLKTPFRTATALRDRKETIWVRLAHEEVEGWGEAAPVETYGQTLESAESALSSMASLLRGNPMHIDRIIEDLLASHGDQRAAVAAVDAALHDWVGKRFGICVTSWLGLDPGRHPDTSFTIGIDEPDRLVEKVLAAEEYPILKIKLGGDQDERLLSTVRQHAPEKTLRVDANTAWSVDEALGRLPMLAAFGVELLEQPIAAEDYEGLRRLKEANVCAIVADESCVVPADVVSLAGCVDGINIKMSKCGGIREAVRMIHLARGMGMRVMLGCMIESGLGVAAAAQLAPLVDWLDLDSHLLLSTQPFIGLGGRGGRLTIGGGPGLGVGKAECLQEGVR